jgi:hypothetical protein|tara:strand:+ start:625 stop:921 length:297 start_codon:yes stop_codon:yes gene_type:complete
MALTTKDFDKWMKRVGPIKSDIEDSKLTTAQIKILKEYPECQTANDLPFDIQQDIIKLNEGADSSELQSEVDAFLGYQYSLLSRNFRDFVATKGDPLR